jgi:glucosamine-6-phosphate deaminase
MDVWIEDDEAAVASLAADFVQASLAAASPTIGLATGGTPVATYEELIRRHDHEGVRFDHAHYVLLDEYVGIPADHPQSYRRFIREIFTDSVGVPGDHVHGPAGDAADIQQAAEDYERLLSALPPREIQILGIGRDGHIGFNEPLSSLASRTRIKTLHPKTRADNERFFEAGEQVPVHAITMGIGTISEARRLLLLATGEAKAEAVAATVEGPVSASVPASALQLHPVATLVLDRAAASALRFREYHEAVAANRPDWQRP